MYVLCIAKPLLIKPPTRLSNDVKDLVHKADQISGLSGAARIMRYVADVESAQFFGNLDYRPGQKISHRYPKTSRT